MAKKQSQFMLVLLIISAAALVVLAAGVLLLNNQFQRKKALDADNDSLTATCVQYEANTSKENMERLRKQKAKLDEQLSTLDHDLVTYQYIPTFLAEIQNAAAMSNNQLVSITPSEVKPLVNSALMPESAAGAATTAPAQTEMVGQGGTPAAGATDQNMSTSKYHIQQLVIDVRGTYGSTMHLLDLLRKFPKLVYLRSVNLNPTEGDGVVMHLETYAVIIPDQYKAPVEKNVALTHGEGVQQ